MAAVAICYLHAIVQQLDSGDRAVVLDQVPDLALECLDDFVHAADGLKERGLVIVVLLAVKAMLPEPGIQQVFNLQTWPRFAKVDDRCRIFAERVPRRTMGSWRTWLSRLEIAED